MKSLQAKLEKIRSEIEALSAERDDIETAPLPRTEVEAKVDAALAAPWSDTILDPRPGNLARGEFDTFALKEMIERPALLIAAFPDALRAYILSLYDQDVDGAKVGLPTPQRRKKLAEIAAQVFELETQEEAVCEQLEALGGDVLRRGDASAAAQLGLGAPDTAA